MRFKLTTARSTATWRRDGNVLLSCAENDKLYFVAVRHRALENNIKSMLGSPRTPLALLEEQL